MKIKIIVNASKAEQPYTPLLVFQSGVVSLDLCSIVTKVMLG